MARKRKLSIENIVLIISIICLISIIFTWESKGEASSVEKTVAFVIIPAQNGINNIGDWVKDRVNFLGSIGELEDLNSELQLRVDQLEYENQILDENKIELERLRELYELDKRYAEFPKIGAQVIAKQPGDWYDNFVINKGEKDGLTSDMVVLSGNGLVGYISEVGPNHATVKTIINDTSQVSATISRTEDMCIVSGDKSLLSNKAYCNIKNIADDANIIKGDEIVTSHLGGRYPPGIIIGSIVAIEDKPHLMTKVAKLETAADFKHIEEVLVITNVWEDYKEVE